MTESVSKKRDEKYLAARDAWLENEAQLSDTLSDYKKCCDWSRDYAKAEMDALPHARGNSDLPQDRGNEIDLLKKQLSDFKEALENSCWCGNLRPDEVCEGCETLAKWGK